MSLGGRRSDISMNRPSWAFVTSLPGIGGSPLLISTGVRRAELQFDSEGKVMVGVGPNSLIWFKSPPLTVESKGSGSYE